MGQSLVHEEGFRGYALDAYLDQVKTFVNPIMKSLVVSYVLKDDVSVKLTIYNARDQLVYDDFFILGNPGGRKGDNKVIWKGIYKNGLKVPLGKYKAVLIQYPSKKEKNALFPYNIKKKIP